MALRRRIGTCLLGKRGLGMDDMYGFQSLSLFILSFLSQHQRLLCA